jgi:hypothetical protein
VSYNRIDPGIDISHYGAPYKGMLGLPAGLGSGWTGTPSEDPRMVKQFTTVRATWTVSNVPSEKATQVGQRLLAEAQRLFSGNTVRMIGTNGWMAGGRVGYDVILAAPMRAGEIKQKNFTAGRDAQAWLRRQESRLENASLNGAQTLIPSNGFEAAPASAPPTPEVAPSAPDTLYAPAEQSSENFLTQDVGGLPVWGLGLIGLAVVGGLGFVLLSKPKAKAPTPNRRRRRSRR